MVGQFEGFWVEWVLNNDICSLRYHLSFDIPELIKTVGKYLQSYSVPEHLSSQVFQN